jgi:uncharacterized protein with GYD domain
LRSSDVDQQIIIDEYSKEAILCFFVTLVKLRRKPSKVDMERMKAGLKESKIYFTLGRYDALIISECPDEKAHMKTAMQFVDLGSSGQW